MELGPEKPDGSEREGPQHRTPPSNDKCGDHQRRRNPIRRQVLEQVEAAGAGREPEAVRDEARLRGSQPRGETRLLHDRRTSSIARAATNRSSSVSLILRTSRQRKKGVGTTA
jgi:hypothetical protein